MSCDLLENENTNQDGKASDKELHGLFVAYKDDHLNESVKVALRRKSRVWYKCMDTIFNFLAFGTSGGAIYLYRLATHTHSSCSLVSMIPCDQGSIEVIKFLPNAQTDELLVVIGTSRGSVVIFRLIQMPGEQNPFCNELYKAECFTGNCSIKLIERDLDLLNPAYPFTKLYICDTANRLYVLESSTVYASKNSLRLFYSNHLPSLIFSVNDSKINQISVHRSQLLISTDETTRLFDEQSNQLNVIGKKKRREGFYGACFFNPNYKPMRLMQVSQMDNTASTYSLNETENLLMFVSRPMFRLWQVNCQRSVMFTHQFESMIKKSTLNQIITIHNETLGDGMEDDADNLLNDFIVENDNQSPVKRLYSDHFQKLVPIYSSTLGNLLLSFTKHEVFVVDPIEARLIVWHSQEEPIIEICSNENELFIWSQEIHGDRREFHLKRLVLLAPTQLVLELHRIHRFKSLIVFVQLYTELFRHRMALPLSGSSTITTEGGLLRNIILNAWDMYQDEGSNEFDKFREIVDEIIEESTELRNSLNNLSDSRFFLTMTNDNIDRLCSEPYASLVSLDVSIADLHTNHVIHFSKDALNRHQSVANLSQSIKKMIKESNQRGKSISDLSNRRSLATLNQSSNNKPIANQSIQKLSDTKVIVERLRPKRHKNMPPINNDQLQDPINEIDPIEKNVTDPVIDSQPFFSPKSRDEKSWSGEEDIDENKTTSRSIDSDTNEFASLESTDDHDDKLRRCNNCSWPLAINHSELMRNSQRIQQKWIEDNLMSNFEENIDRIEDQAFKHGLWNMYLKCLAFRNHLDDYIICCMMLDDIRLLDIEQFVITRGEEEIMDHLFTHLGRKLGISEDQTTESEEIVSEEVGRRHKCLKCDHPLDLANLQQPDDYEFSFNLVNLLEHSMMRRNANAKKVIRSLLKFRRLLSASKIPIVFYLKAIATSADK